MNIPQSVYLFICWWKSDGFQSVAALRIHVQVIMWTSAGVSRLACFVLPTNTGTFMHLFIHLLSIVAFALQQQGTQHLGRQSLKYLPYIFQTPVLVYISTVTECKAGFQLFIEMAKLFSRVVVPLHISTIRVGHFQLLRILAKT